MATAVRVKSIAEVESPYATDKDLAKYLKKSYRATQDFLREMEKVPEAAKWMIFFGGRCTHIRAAIEYDHWRRRTKGMARKPPFDFRE